MRGLVTHTVHFRSHDKDGGYTIRSAVPENSMLHANIKALFDRTGVIGNLSFTFAGIGIFAFLAPVTLTLIR